MVRVLLGPAGVLAERLSRSTASEHNRPKRPPRRWVVVQGATLLLAVGVLVFALVTNGLRPPDPPASVAPDTPAAEGLPDEPDYHGLLVSPDDPERVLLGTHNGVYESLNGGRTWKRTTLAGSDAMSLTAAPGSTVWASGHDVLALSNDGGTTWATVVPRGLPSLDIHAFAVDPEDSQNLYAAIAGQGLYHSRDGGTSFELVSDQVGGSVVSLAFTNDGQLLASDSERGLLTSADEGRSWEALITTRLLSLAVNPEGPGTILAAGPGVLLSWDSGRSFQQVLHLEQGAGSVAWAPSNADVGYALGRDGVLYRTEDRGTTWRRAV